MHMPVLLQQSAALPTTRGRSSASPQVARSSKQSPRVGAEGLQQQAPSLPCSPPQRRAMLLSSLGTALHTILLGAAPARADGEEGPAAERRTQEALVTSVAYLELGLCKEGLRTDRAIGDASALCSEPQSLGRLIIGLFGEAAPSTVANFHTLLPALVRTTVNKIIPGEYVTAGRQGPQRMGLLKPPPELAPNQDVLASSAFRLEHRRPGTLSLNLSENDDDERVRSARGFPPSQFLITTGPGPAPSLDGRNVVFGRVLEGWSTLEEVARVPVFKPSERVQAWNSLAKFIGDERADRVKKVYGRPLKAVVITEAGQLPIRAPFPVAA